MPILKDIREAEHPATYESLPIVVQEKVCAIEVLFDRAILYLWAREEASKGVPDFESFLRDFYKNKVRGANKSLAGILKDLLPKLEAEPDDWLLIWAEDHESCVKKLADSRYYPWAGSWSHLLLMLYELWIYWLFWPSGRRFFEEGNETSAWYLGPRPPAPPLPSTPSFEARLDLSLLWLAHEVGREITKIQHWEEKREGIAQRNLERRETYIATDNKIVDAFHAVPKKESDYLNSIVERIYEVLGKNTSKKTIERHLQKNLVLMAHNFVPEEWGGKKRFKYIRHTGV